MQKNEKYDQKIDKLISKKRNYNNLLSFSFSSIMFLLKLTLYINKKRYLSFDTYIFPIKIIIYFFSIIYKINYKIKII